MTSLWRSVLFPNQYDDVLAHELRECSTILDLGCGRKSPIGFIGNAYKIGVDAHEPYLVEAKRSKTHDDYILADAASLAMVTKFDAVVALSVIEHLTRREGVELIKHMELLAGRKIVVSTPNGFLPQDCYDGNELQVHKSGWTIQDFEELGFRVYGIFGLKQLRIERGLARFRPYRFCYVISSLSQAVTYHVPKIAFELFCVKDIKRG